MKRFAAVAIAICTCACGHDARAPMATPDGGSERPTASAAADASASNDDAAATRRALPSEQDVRARAAAIAPGFRVDHVETRAAPFRVDIGVGDAGASCFRVVVASDSAVDVHVEDGSGPRGKETHGEDAIVPDDGPLCVASVGGHAGSAVLVARGSANVRFAVVVPR